MTARGLGFAAILLASLGCAGTRAISPVQADRYEGRVVTSVTLNDGTNVWFDDWETAGRGPDTRGRIRGDAVVGYVDGVLSKYLLSDLQEVRLGVDDSPKGQGFKLLGIVLALSAVFAVVVLLTWNPAPFN